jgi:hypothetical protein
LAQFFADFLRQSASKQIGCAPGWERHDQAHGFGGVALRLCQAQAGHGQGGGAQATQEMSFFHVDVPLTESGAKIKNRLCQSAFATAAPK